jgi:antitoxin HicB
MIFSIYIDRDEDNRFFATCPSLPGCVSQGDSPEQARLNIADAIEAYLESHRLHDEPLPMTKP